MIDHTKLKAFINNKFVDFKDANVSISNTSFMYGLAIFTGMRANYNAKTDELYLFRPKAHYERLLSTSKAMFFQDFVSTYTYEKFLNIIKELIKINNIKGDIYIRPSVYLNEVKIGPKLTDDYKDDLCVFLYPLGDYVPTGGMQVMTSSFTRVSDNAIPPRFKVNGAYVNTALAKTEALRNGYSEAIVLDQNGYAVEGSAENLFIVRDGSIITPNNGDILEGVTRKSIIKIAQDLGYTILERPIQRTELYFADEIFFTGTGAKVSAVTEIDKRIVSNGQIGKITKDIQSTYFDTVIGNISKYSSWLERV